MRIIQIIINKISQLQERNIFIGVLFINLFLISTIKFYPSMDGPAHLYNSNLIRHLIQGNTSILSDFFAFNNKFVPNYTSHFILSILLFIFPAWLAEKILLYFYIIGMAFSFRLLVGRLNPGHKYLTYFIFPFIYSFLFHLGFYNNSLSFIFLFFTLYYWLKTYNKQTILNYLVIAQLILITYFSSILIFCFLGLCLGLFIVTFEIKENKGRINYHFKNIIKKLGILLLISIPAIILFVIFYRVTNFYSTNNRYSFSKLTK
jgi:hypothetical protein